MPQRSLTDRFCTHAKAASGEAQTDYFDADTTGLALRVFRSGAKSWMYRFSWGGKRKWMTFGTYPATGLASARTRADEARAAIEAGTDPRTALAKPETLRSICEEWSTREAGALRSGEVRKAALARLVYPTLGDHPINDLRRSDLVRLLDRIEDERGPAMADKTLAIMRRIFNWHASRIKQKGGSMTLTEIGKSFQNNLQYKSHLDDALTYLIDTDQLICKVDRTTGGRPKHSYIIPG
jgi:hypothetical protein